MNEKDNSVSGNNQQSASLTVIEYIILYDKETTYTVSRDFYNAVLYQVEGILPALIPGKKYTLKILCGELFWDPLDGGERRMAGRCMVDMVAKDLLPLRFAESRHEYPKYYQLG